MIRVSKRICEKEIIVLTFHPKIKIVRVREYDYT